MGRFLVGSGLVVMASAIAFFHVVADDPGVPVSAVNSAASTAFWVFTVGVLIAITGGLQAKRRQF